MNPTEWRAAGMTAVAQWLTTLPSWGGEHVGLRSSADNHGDWVLSFDGTRPAVDWVARVVVTCAPTPAESWVIGIPHPPSGIRHEVTVRWILSQQVAGRNWGASVRAVVAVAAPSVWTDALRAAATPEPAPAPNAAMGTAGELDGQGDLLAELADV